MARAPHARMMDRWKGWARRFKVRLHTVALVARHPRVPWYAKALAVAVVAYALSPVDLIPDFIPVLGHLDDLVLVPLGIALVIRLAPRGVWAECEAAAASAQPSSGGSSRNA